MVFAFAGDSTMTSDLAIGFSECLSTTSVEGRGAGSGAAAIQSHESAAVHALDGASKLHLQKTLKKRNAIHDGAPGELIEIVGLRDRHVEEDWILRRGTVAVGSIRPRIPDPKFRIPIAESRIPTPQSRLYFFDDVLRGFHDSGAVAQQRVRAGIAAAQHI